MNKYLVKCHMPTTGFYIERLVEAYTIHCEDGAYFFLDTEDKFIISFPVQYTIVEALNEVETEDIF